MGFAGCTLEVPEYQVIWSMVGLNSTGYIFDRQKWEKKADRQSEKNWFRVKILCVHAAVNGPALKLFSCLTWINV